MITVGKYAHDAWLDLNKRGVHGIALLQGINHGILEFVENTHNFGVGEGKTAGGHVLNKLFEGHHGHILHACCAVVRIGGQPVVDQIIL